MTWLIIVGALVAYVALGLFVARAVATEDDERLPFFVLSLVGLWPFAVGYWTIDGIVFGGLRQRRSKAVELRKRAAGFGETAKTTTDVTERNILTAARDELIREAEAIERRNRG